MTKEEKEENLNLQEMEKLKEQNQQLETQLAILMDLNSLKDQSVYRRQHLMILERIALALENLENSFKEEVKESN